MGATAPDTLIKPLNHRQHSLKSMTSHMTYRTIDYSFHLNLFSESAASSHTPSLCSPSINQPPHLPQTSLSAYDSDSYKGLTLESSFFPS